MPLVSRFLKDDPALQACLVSDPAHVVPGARGPHVGRIQTAMIILDGATIAESELATETYGPSTAAAVLAYKRSRSIINPAYQTSADNIVGKMTIKAIDDELEARQEQTSARRPERCGVNCQVHAGRGLKLPPGRGRLPPGFGQGTEKIADFSKVTIARV